MKTKQGSYIELNRDVLAEINSGFLSHRSVCLLCAVVCKHTQKIFWKGIFYSLLLLFFPWVSRPRCN